MKKLIYLLVLSVLITGCFKKSEEEYLQKVADIIISFNESENYNKKEIKKQDRAIVENYLTSLKQMDQKINISKFINNNDMFREDSPNSEGVYIENDICYINRNNINFEISNQYGPNESTQHLVCNGYYVDIYESDIEINYEEYKKTRKHGYRNLGYNQINNGYIFGYRSFYDGTTTTIEISMNNDTIKSIKVKENQNFESKI